MSRCQEDLSAGEEEEGGADEAELDPLRGRERGGGSAAKRARAPERRRLRAGIALDEGAYAGRVRRQGEGEQTRAPWEEEGGSEDELDGEDEGEGDDAQDDDERLPQARSGGGQPSFVAAESFEGLREGYVFTTAHRGTGYYRDLKARKKLTAADLGLDLSGDELSDDYDDVEEV